PMTGWQAIPATFFDADANARRPSIEVSYASALEDVGWVRVQVRLDADEAVVFDGEVPYSDPYAAKLNAVLIGDTDYEVRGKYIPYSTRQTEWSEWIDVTTPDVPDAVDIQVSQLGQELANTHGLVTGDQPGGIQPEIEILIQRMDDLATG